MGLAQKDGKIRRQPEFWPRQMVKKWISLGKTGNYKFNHDTEMDAENAYEEEEDLQDSAEEFGVDVDDNHANVDLDAVAVAPLSLLRGQSETLRQQFVDNQEFRVAVHTWNVAGKRPPNELDLDDWIDISHPADIYVFGFQEIVPLNAHNVLCVEDEGPAAKWEAKIRETLNKVGQHIENAPFQSRSAPASPCHDALVLDVSDVSDVEKMLGRCVSGKNLETAFLATEGNLLNYEKNLPTPGHEWQPEGPTSENDDYIWPFVRDAPEVTTRDLHEAAIATELMSEKANLVAPLFSSSTLVAHPIPGNRHQYSRVASKQMVGLFITVWVRSHLWRHVHNVKVSAVGRGLMNYLGNKGSISVSMSLHHTSFCFVCAHLTSGHKEGDELRRNADVAEILRRTKFPRLIKLFGIELPETILAHDQVIWLGDLNYRLALREKETWKFVKQSDWKSLMRVDQLKLEQDEGRVFKDWLEGPIYFPPTYKFMDGSDQYSGETTSGGEKRRAPAWCDRILWYGKGLRQVAYTRGKSKLSDHRSVSATFMAVVEIVSHRKLKKACVYPKNINLDVETKENLDEPALLEHHRRLKRTHGFRKLSRASSFVFPESSVSSARA